MYAGDGSGGGELDVACLHVAVEVDDTRFHIVAPCSDGIVQVVVGGIALNLEAHHVLSTLFQRNAVGNHVLQLPEIGYGACRCDGEAVARGCCLGIDGLWELSPHGVGASLCPVLLVDLFLYLGIRVDVQFLVLQQ